MPDNRVMMIGSFDTKPDEYGFVYRTLRDLGCEVTAVDTSVFNSQPSFPVDVPAAEVAQAGGADLQPLRAGDDRGAAMRVMSTGAAAVTRRLYEQKEIAGVFGMGGTGGSSVVTAAMRALPLGVPKVCVSTAAGGDVSAYVAEKDVVMFPSVADIAGVNRITRTILCRAAGAMAGMLQATPPAIADDRPVIAASMFGNTTACVNACRKQLDEKGYEVLVFHATGVGGRTMESLIDEGLVDACLDLTTTEWADTICGGVFAAGEDRLSAAGRAAIPHVIAPGCIDMVNFGPRATVPAAYEDAGRLLHEWNPSITLMRTSVAENEQLGRVFAEKANASPASIEILVPLKGYSILGGEGQPFHDPLADAAFLESLQANIDPSVRLQTIDANINDAAFADAAVDALARLMEPMEASAR